MHELFPVGGIKYGCSLHEIERNINNKSIPVIPPLGDGHHQILPGTCVCVHTYMYVTRMWSCSSDCFAFSLQILQICFPITKFPYSLALSDDFSCNRLELTFIKLSEAVGFQQQSLLRLPSEVLCPEASLKISTRAPASAAVGTHTSRSLAQTD